MVRNIGNQIATAEGSVEYGVRHSHTPLLIIVGHVACGAIKAATGNYSSESDAIKHELNGIKIAIKADEIS
jgi:carbonic anhydrase